MINILVNLGDLSRLQAALLFFSHDNTELMQEVGDSIVESIRNSFRTGIDPYGGPWAPLSAVTLSQRTRGSSKILVDTGVLANSFTAVASKKSVSIGSDVIYAATQQFGAKKGQYGSMKNGSPIPWGDIPARKMLPINNNKIDLPKSQHDLLVDLIKSHVYDVLRGGKRK